MNILTLEGGLGVNINAGVYTEKTGDIQINAGNDIKQKQDMTHLLDVENLISARALGEYRLAIAGGDGHPRVANKHVSGGSEIMENASGEINSQAGGNNNVIGS